MATASEVQLSLETWPYQTKDTIMVPYRAEQTEFYPQDFLVSIYCRLLEEELVDIAFPGMNFTHLHSFLNFFSSPAHPSLFCFLKDETGITTTVGCGVLTESDGRDGCRKAGFAFWFFRPWWGSNIPRTLGWFLLAFWMIELRIDFLFGVTLRKNHLARNFSKNFGFIHIADVPHLLYRRGELQDGTLLLLEKTTFLPLYEKWREEILLAEQLNSHASRKFDAQPQTQQMVTHETVW